MNAKCCDRCGKYYRDTKQEGEELILGTYLPGGDKPTVYGSEFGKGIEPVIEGRDDFEIIDLCPICYKQLYKWLRREKSRPSPAIETPELNGGFVFK